MRIEYISHACLSIRTSDTPIATGPWWAGACYTRQGTMFPKPVDASPVEAAGSILISRAHIYPLHEPTLSDLPAGRTVYYLIGLPEVEAPLAL